MNTQGKNSRELRRIAQIRLISFLLVLTSLFFVVAFVENMLFTAVLAFVIAYLLGPWVNSLERAGLSRTLAAVLVFLSLGVLLVLAAVFSAPMIGEQLGSLRLELPKYIDGVGTLMADTEQRIRSYVGFLNINLGMRVESFLMSSTESFFKQLPGFLAKFVTIALLAPFVAFFMIKDGRAINRSFLNLVPNQVFELTMNLYHQINNQLGHFIRARLLEAVIVGLVTWVGLQLIGFPYAVLLGVFAALTNLIPYVGPVIGALPAALILLINKPSSLETFLVVAVYGVAQLIDIAVIIPLIVAKIVDLHPVTVVVVMIIGAQSMGLLGILISIPAASVLKVTLGTIYQHFTNARA